MNARLAEKAYLSAKGLLNQARKIFEIVKEPSKGGQGEKKEISIVDCSFWTSSVVRVKRTLKPFSIGCDPNAGTPIA